MPQVTFISADGHRTIVDANEGQSIMTVAVNSGIDVILAECGGACSCGTCHCFIDGDWIERVPSPNAMEEAMIECVMNPQPNSRLSCQILMNDELDGLVVHLPGAQY